MTVIKKTIDFLVSEPIDLREMTIEYFLKSGFREKDNNRNDRKLKFERGSVSSNMWMFNPLNWKSEIEIEINDQEVKANFNINTTGQIPTKEDELLWETFINNYRKYLNDSNFDFLIENSKTLKSTKSKNLKYLGWAALGGIIGGIPSGLIANWTGINSIVSIGAAGGAIAMLSMKINQEKKKNVL